MNESLDEVKRISKRLRKERELSFYGAEDFIPTEEYDLEDAQEAIRDAELFSMRFRMPSASLRRKKRGKCISGTPDNI